MKINPNKIIVLNSILKEQISDFIKVNLKNSGIKDLKPSHSSVIGIILNNGGKVQIKTIYDNISKNKSTVTEILNTLEKNNYIVREQSKVDKRITYVATTSQIEKIKPTLKTLSKELLETLFNNFSEDEKLDFARLLNKAIKNFK